MLERAAAACEQRGERAVGLHHPLDGRGRQDFLLAAFIRG
jgi:hypothetical protein